MNNVQKLVPKTIYQDKSILIIEKPSGLVIHSGTGVKEKYTLVDWLKKTKLVSNDFTDSNRPGIVHRLDKDTSGLMIIAKDQKTADKLKKQFKERKVKKYYQALVWGTVVRNLDTIVSSIGRKPADTKIRTTGRGRIAITKYKVIKIIKKDKFDLTYLNIEIKTGRTHQIRVHLKSIGHPLVGDKIYAKQKLNLISKKWGINRIFLHALKLKFIHPSTGKNITFISKLPIELSKQII